MISIVAGFAHAPVFFGLQDDQLPSQVTNVLRELGVIASAGRTVDPIAELLSFRYGLPKRKSWHTLLGGEYVHALGVLRQADVAFDSGRSRWLIYQNSLNQTNFLALQAYLRQANLLGACTVINKNGELVDFGVTLQAGGPFSQAFPNVGACFRDMNARRNRLPAAHPYDKKSAAQTKYLSVQGRNKLVARLRVSYADLYSAML